MEFLKHDNMIVKNKLFILQLYFKSVPTYSEKNEIHSLESDISE